MFPPIRSLLVIHSIIHAFLNTYVHACIWQSPDDLVVELDQGTIAGTFFDYIGGGGRYRAFLGIPYAQPPINQLRFMPPVPVAQHEGVLDATQFSSPCVQKARGAPIHLGSEDCLYLNVYVPITVDDSECQKLPVMFYIHGGGYVAGDGSRNKCGPDFLLKKDVIVVTINYRLGVFGFLAAPDLGIYGNMGVKDQRLALKWTYDNIEKFGGDKERIMVFGQSGGGASANHLLMDPTANTYISGAILQSSCALNPWNIQFQPETRFKSLTDALSIPYATLYELQSVTATDLVNAAVDIVPTQDDLNRLQLLVPIYVPTVEDPRSQDPVLTEAIQAKIDRGELPDRPIIMGFNDFEGIFVIADALVDPYKVTNTLRDINRVVPRDFNTWEDPQGELEQQAIGKLNTLYGIDGDWEHTKTDDEKLHIFMHIIGDLLITHGIYRTLKGALNTPGRTAPLYFYKLSDDSYSSFKLFVLPANYQSVPGSSNEDDLGYIWTMLQPYDKFIGAVDHIPDEGRLTNERMVTMWTNFAKTGNPTSSGLDGVTWDPITDEFFGYLEIKNAPIIGMQPFAELATMEVWDQVRDLGMEAQKEREQAS